VMKIVVRNILAIVVGWIIGSAVNMGLIQLGYALIPLEGIDPSDMDSLAQIMPTLDAHYFIFPFLGHALGTFVGALTAALLAVNHKIKFALAIGFLFSLGGIAVNMMLPGPLWFTITDLLLAYIPMAWFGGTLALRLSK